MCGSDIRTVKGGMVTVEKNYLEYPGWKKAEITFIPTHTEGNPLQKCLCFAGGWRKVLGCLIRKRADILHLHMAERGSFYRKAWLLKLGHWFGFQQIIGAFPLPLCAQHEDSVYICSVRSPVRDRHCIM